jgi:ubiquinone/menaquinone biosynthesis C-methylase UbiE
VTDSAASFRIPAEAYDRFVGRYSGALAQELCDAAGVRTPASALDVGCGPGALAAELASRLGPERVAAIDPSEPFAAAARSRLPGVRVETGAAEALPFADGEFDFALAQLVVNFMTDALAGVREMRRVSRGVVAAAVWDYKERMTLLRTFWDAALEVDPTAGERDEGRRMGYATPNDLAGLWRAAGLGHVAVGPVTVVAAYADFEDLWAPLERGAGPAGAYTTSLEPERRAALKAELRRRLDAGNGPFRLTARAWVVTGR